MIFKLTIQPNITESNPTRLSFDIGRAQISTMKVSIPDGHKYLAHFQTRTRGRIIIPEFGSGELWVVGNDMTVNIIPPQPIILDGPPYEITLIGWNEDDTYPHSFHLEVN